MTTRNASMLYAAYGSNLHPERLRRRVPSATLAGTAVIAGRALRFHKRGRDSSAKCNIVAYEGEVHVAVYRIAAVHKPRLDRAESLGVGYRIEPLDLPPFGACFTYVALDSHVHETLQPFPWYLELVLAGCRHHGFPQPYIDRIAALASLADPDPERHARHMDIVRHGRAHLPRKFGGER